MSERYSRLFTLPENLYAVGSPVVIAAGTLLKDNQTGKIVAQLKLRSISDKVIKAVKVRLDLFDTAGNPIGDPVAYEYLDLKAARDMEFGQKNPVPLVESKARSYEASVTEVVFADRSVWAANMEDWEPLSRPVLLKISDPELLKQYRIRFGYRSTYEPKEEKDLWYCTCGELNHAGEGCHCGNSLFELQTVDMDALDKEKNVRLAEEARQAEEEKTAREAAATATQKKTAKILKIAIPVICAAAAFVLLINRVIIPNGKYNNAVSLMEAGQYGEAVVAFEKIEGYKDSSEKIKYCEEAIIAAEQARIEAEKAAADAILEEKYNSAVLLMNKGKTTEAIVAFEELNGYRDSAEKASVIRITDKIEKLKTADVGDYVIWGSYEQDYILANGAEAIEWQVLAKEDHKLLLISRYALDWQPYNEEYESDATWETCSLRTWLNQDFLNGAFFKEEREMIPTVTVTANESFSGPIDPGVDTQDKVFLLSATEVIEYLGDKENRVCQATSWKTGNCQWWLRTPSDGIGCYVSGDGLISRYSYERFNEISHAVRPAMWISLS